MPTQYTDIYITRQGDMFDLIAYKIYGDEKRMAELLEANPAHAKTLVFGAGVQLVVPDIVVPVSDSIPVWARQ